MTGWTNLLEGSDANCSAFQQPRYIPENPPNVRPTSIDSVTSSSYQYDNVEGAMAGLNVNEGMHASAARKTEYSSLLPLNSLTHPLDR